MRRPCGRRCPRGPAPATHLDRAAPGGLVQREPARRRFLEHTFGDEMPEHPGQRRSPPRDRRKIRRCGDARDRGARQCGASRQRARTRACRGRSDDQRSTGAMSARGDGLGGEERLDDVAQLRDRSGGVDRDRRCEPLSRPFVYQEFSARSLLITQRSRPRAGLTVGASCPGARWRNPSASSTRSLSSRSM